MSGGGAVGVRAVRTGFRLSGEALTEHARQLVLSEKAAAAYRILAEGLAGVTSDAVVSVLRGTHKFVGEVETGYETVPEDPADVEDYRADYAQVYAGRTRFRERWYRPCAYVGSVGPEGFPRRQTKVSDYVLANEYTTAHREHLAVVWEPAGEAPFWEPVKDPARALAEWLAAGNELEERGYSVDGGQRTDYCYEDPQPPPPQPLREEAPRPDPAEREAVERAAHEAEIARIRAAVVAAAGDDWLELREQGADPDDQGSVVARVPAVPFKCWALGRTVMRDLMPAWTPVSPSGMKMYGDDPYHSDWWHGAGFTDENPYEGPVYEAAFREMFRIQKEHGGFKCTVLAGERSYCGEVGKDVAVVPDLRPERLPALVGVKALVTEAGGAGAHLVQVLGERGIPIVAMPGAVKRFPKGVSVSVNPVNGTVNWVAGTGL